MTAVITDSGKIRALELLVNDITHIGFGRPDPGWSDEFNPPSEDVTDTDLVDTIGYAKVSTRGWLVVGTGGTGTPFTIDGITYTISATPTTIGYVEATIPSGQAEGTSNKIGQIGVFGKDVLTSPSNATWVLSASITTPGTLFRTQNIPVFIKLSNTSATFLVAFPLVA